MIVRLKNRQGSGLRISADVNSPRNQKRYAALLTRLRASNNGTGSPPSALGVIACESSRPSAAVAVGLAMAGVDNDDNTLLVDLSGPSSPLTRWLKLRSAEGISDVLAGSLQLVDSVRKDAESAGLAFAAWGHAKDASYRPAHLERWKTVIAQAREEYDLVVVALPPATESSPGPAFSATLDGVLLVIESEKTSVAAATRARVMLERTHARILGAVLHNCRNYLPSWLRRRI